MPDLSAITARQRAQILAADEGNLRRIADAYGLLYDRLQGDIDAVTKAIAALENPTGAQIRALSEFKRLERRARDELARFTLFTETTIEAASLDAIRLGLRHSSDFVSLALGRRFAGLDTRAMQPLLKFLRKDGPLYARLTQLTGATVEAVKDSIIEGVGLGYNPRRIASAIRSSFGGGLTDALRNTRTVQIWSYRESARANYIATDGIVSGWMWYARLNENTCASCIAQHGTVHPLDETLDDHYNGSCVPIPYIEGFTDNVQSGEDWFNSLAEKNQREILGSGKYDAYKEGKFQFSRLSKQVENDVYGSMRTVASLAELTGE